MAHVAGLEVCHGGSSLAHAAEDYERKEGGGDTRKEKGKDRPFMRSWVREIRPRTFVANIVSMSLSWILPMQSSAVSLNSFLMTQCSPSLTAFGI